MIIVEGKLEDLSKKYIPKFDKDRGRFIDGLTPEIIIEHFYLMDPSSTKKYFEWMIKQSLNLIEGNFVISNENIANIVRGVQLFDNNINKLDDNFIDYYKDELGAAYYEYLKGKPLKDINTYKFDILNRLVKLLVNYQTESQRKKMAKQGANLVFEDNKYYIFEINTYEASCFYGAGSQWCTTNKNTDTHFKSYGVGNKKLLYVISKTKTIESDPKYYKIAIQINYSDKIINFFDAPDRVFDGWEFFNEEDSDVIVFLISYIKENDPDNYLSLIPIPILISFKQEKEGLSDYDVLKEMSENDINKWLKYKYRLNDLDVILKKLDILLDGGERDLNEYFTINEKRLLIGREDEYLTPKGLDWTNFVKDYHQLGIVFSDYLPSKFIDVFLNGDKNKLLSLKSLLIPYWLYVSKEKCEDLGEIYGAEKIVKYIIKNNIKVVNVTESLSTLLKNETPKKRKELYEIAYKHDGKDKQYYLVEFLVDKMGKLPFIASFNQKDSHLVEPESYRRAFLYVKRNEPNMIYKVFDSSDLNKIFSSESKAFEYFIKNYHEFVDEITLEELTDMFEVENIDFSSREYKYMSDWEKKRATNLNNIINKSKKLFDFVLRKFSFKKLAEIIGYDGLFQLFSVVRFKKGINYIISKRLGSVRIDDIRIQDGKIILVVKDRRDYAFLYDDEKLAESILGEDFDWVPYDNTVYNWYEQVWGCVDSKSIEYIKAWIKENVVEYENDEGDVIDLGDTYLNEISNDELGHIIDGYSEFEELKKEMSWAYDSAYNGVAMNEIVSQVQDELETYLGKYIGYEPYKITKRVKNSQGEYEDREYTQYQYLYDLGNHLYDILYDYAIENWGYDVDYDTYFSTLLKESDFEKIYIDTDLYPDSDDICEYFNDDLPGRI